MVKFDEASHRYSHNGDRYTSATQLIDLVANKFDTKGQAARMAIQHGQTPEYWEGKWRRLSQEALDKGTALHLQQEELLTARGVDVDEGKVYRVQNADLISSVGTPDYFYWPDGVYPELLLWNHEYKIAGRADKVILSTHKSGYRFANIQDHKTNKKLRDAWFTPGEGYRRLRYPLAHLKDSDIIKYTLQMSIYQFMLEEMGFRAGKRVLLHYPPLPVGLGQYEGQLRKKPYKYKLDYLRNDVLLLINLDRNEQNHTGP